MGQLAVWVRPVVSRPIPAAVLSNHPKVKHRFEVTIEVATNSEQRILQCGICRFVQGDDDVPISIQSASSLTTTTTEQDDLLYRKEQGHFFEEGIKL